MAEVAEPFADPTRAEIAELADKVIELMRAFTRARSKLLAVAEHDVEWSAHVLLRCVSVEGPIRSSTLAERVESDPSTVSRQVAALVKDGLLERRADPEDGRACLLVATDKAGAVLHEHEDLRMQYFTRLLDGWSERDVRRFSSLLQRFTKDFTQVHDDWLTERLATRVPPAEGTTA